MHQAEVPTRRDPLLDFPGDLEVPGQTGERRQVAGRLRPSDDRSDPGNQLVDVERLGDVVVGAQLESPHSILGEATGGEQDDRYVAGRGLAAEPMEGGEPVHAGHHDVEDDHMWGVGRGLPQGVFTVDSGLDLEAFQLEVDLDDGENVRIVVHDEDSFTH